MGSFIVKQPNGKLCRFSTIVDCPTHINMTEDDYIRLCMEKAKKEAMFVLQHGIQPYKKVNEYFRAGNMTKKEFIEVKKKMRDPNGQYEQL